MRHPRHWQIPAGIGVLTTGLALCAAGVTGPAPAAGPGAPTLSASITVAGTGAVSAKPASGTPHLARTKSLQEIRQLVKCGNTMYAVGRFWKILWNGHKYSRNNVFSFRVTAPYRVTGWNPNVDGEAESIAFASGSGCRTAYLGGDFRHVHGKAAAYIAAVSTRTGAIVPGFRHDANGMVDTLVSNRGHLLAGGKFTRINGTSRPYFASLSPSTGSVGRFANLHVKGHVTGMAEQIYKQQLSHSGRFDLVEGNFTAVAGQPRQQIFMLDLTGSTAKLTGWTSPEFSGRCRAIEAFYVRSAAWSPNDSTVYVADTGDHPLHRKIGSFPLYGLCDAVAAFPATHKSVHHKWVEYSGCDSYYSVAADDTAVYAGGHPRWADNPDGCNHAGPNAVADPGMQGLSPGTGRVLTNAQGKARYQMSRANADDMLITSRGLWVASSNRFGSRRCNGVSGHAGICYLRYP
jgi:hypothetical protein